MEYTTETDTYGYRIVIFLITLIFFIFAVINANNYRKILDVVGDEEIGLGRGTVIWFLWLNILLATICLVFFLYNLIRFFVRKTGRQLIPEGVREYLGGKVDYDDVFKIEKPSVDEIVKFEKVKDIDDKISKKEEMIDNLNSQINSAYNRYIKNKNETNTNALNDLTSRYNYNLKELESLKSEKKLYE